MSTLYSPSVLVNSQTSSVLSYFSAKNLQCGLFVYDVFWVFFTPVMVSVAKSFDAPIKVSLSVDYTRLHLKSQCFVYFFLNRDVLCT